ncbi:MFS general substrate transporter [Artomyces pyxidatus]|uniref:MFS general substrate transporter n=1 Tax=Artomyces pyxidatus TaxID=48021 RepID=A0ACB8SM44_9AGAM|nr:MFS general substrate transporter [Artomyces pyxidatus]
MESDLLLPDQVSGRAARTSGWLSPSLSILPVVFIGRLSAELPMTTFLDILLQAICRFYPVEPGHDSTWLEGGDACREPRVLHIYSVAITVYVFLQTSGAFIMYGPISGFSSKLGRKPVFFALILLCLASNIFMLLSWKSTAGIKALLLCLWALSSSLAGTAQFDLVSDMYGVDITVNSNDRTTVLSFIKGATLLGGLPAYALGGIITRQTRSDFVVYSISAILDVIMAAYVCAVLPESFSPEDRRRLREEQEAEQTSSSPVSTGRRYATLLRLRAILWEILYPFTLLPPHRDSSTNQLNLRIFWCGMYFFLSNLGFGYSLYALMTYLTVVLNYKPDDNGYVLTAASVSSVFSLFVLTPCMVKYVRPLFNARKIPRVQNGETTDGTPDTVPSGTQFEIHIAAMGWMMDIVAMLSVPFARSRVQVLLLLVLYGIGTCRIPVSRTIAAASVEPIRSGELLSAVQMAGAVGATLSTVFLGFVLSTTISTHPSTVFWVYAMVEAMAIGTLYCIRDEDRYIPQASTEE